MEALIETTSDSLLDLTPNYDASRQSFLSTSDSSSSVRYVTNKLLPAQHPKNVIGGGSFGLDPKDYTKTKVLSDTFTGIIDGISGELLHGTREYILTGEIYEGPFKHGKRHGDGAIVKNIYLPLSSITGNGSMSSLPNITKGARFYGSYKDDSPIYGTLVLPSLFTYQGPLLDSKPHGENGTLIKPSGYKYEGGFQNGLYHGTGVEDEALFAGGGSYKGDFAAGSRQGYGEYVIKCQGKELHKDDNSDDGIQQQANENIYKYKGQWVANSKQGEGEEVIAGKETYRGQFYANERHGYGCLTYEGEQIEEPVKNDIGASSSSETLDQQTLNELDTTDHLYEYATVSEPYSRFEEHVLPIIVEGSWRAGHPLHGTQGWTLIYGNGDIYTGYASDFIPCGYGVMRYGNKDMYSGNWKDGKRNGEGCFISGNGKEEYVGEWKQDKIVPMSEGERNERMERLTDMTLLLLRGRDNSEVDEYSAHDVLREDSSYQYQMELLESTVQQSLRESIKRMNDHNVDVEQPWSPVTGEKWLRGRMLRAQVDRRVTSACKGKLETGVESDELNDSQDSYSNLSQKPTVSIKTELKTYRNGDTYLGSFCPTTGHREGYGVYLSVATGSTYSGDFEDDVKQGYGILMHPLGKYCGDFVNDCKHGMGTLILDSASSYNGNFQNNELNGKGTLCTKDSVYVGDFCKGTKHGQGYETLPDGRVYMGGYEDGRRSGFGKLFEKTGGPIIYRGSWFGGLFHGEGVQRVSQADLKSSTNQDGHYDLEYEGSFFNGLRHGFGTLSDSCAGTVCKGRWHNDKPISSKWRITLKDDSVYSGEAKVNEDDNSLEEVEGATIWTDLPQSDIPPMSNNFSIDIPIPHGFGAMKYENGDIFIGMFKDGLRHGNGSLFQNGEKLEGIWEKGVFINTEKKAMNSTTNDYDNIHIQDRL